MHAYTLNMRTTVEIPDDLRLRLIEESARGGERGYSGVITRALTQYFSRDTHSEGIRNQIDDLFGCQPDADVPVTRQSWRTGRTGYTDESS